MNSSKIRLFISLLIMLLLFVGCNNGKKTDTVKDFSIYLVKDLTTTQAISNNLDDLPLESTPILTQREIKTYKWDEHEFTLKEGFILEEKLKGNFSVPFVVVVGGERIYLGSFSNPLSSLYHPEIPNIFYWMQGSGKDTYTISKGNKEENRNDRRIYESLKGFGKIMD